MYSGMMMPGMVPGMMPPRSGFPPMQLPGMPPMMPGMPPGMMHFPGMRIPGMMGMVPPSTLPIPQPTAAAAAIPPSMPSATAPAAAFPAYQPSGEGQKVEAQAASSSSAHLGGLEQHPRGGGPPAIGAGPGAIARTRLMCQDEAVSMEERFAERLANLQRMWSQQHGQATR